MRLHIGSAQFRFSALLFKESSKHGWFSAVLFQIPKNIDKIMVTIVKLAEQTSLNNVNLEYVEETV